MTENDDQPVASDEHRSRRPMVAVAVSLVIIVGVAVAWGVQQRDEAAESRALVSRQREAVLVATGFVEALLSYRHDDLDTHQAAVERFATDEFRDEYVDAFTTEVRQQIIDEQASSTVTVEEVYVTLDEGDELTAIVVARSEVSSALGASAALESLLRIRLSRHAGRWRVNDLTSLGSRDRSVPLPGQLPDQETPEPEESESDG